MGEARRKKARSSKFLEENPWCCLCGGSVAATTIEHAPPKVFFINKEVPAATHRMPACERCNNGSGSADQVAALCALIQATVHRNIPNEYIEKLIQGVSNNAPDAFSAIAAGGSQDVPLRVNGREDLFSKVEINPVIYTDWLNPWAAKQAYALYYLHSGGKILSPLSRVMVQWYSNESAIYGTYPDDLVKVLRNYGDLRQGSKNSLMQYVYRWQIDENVGCFVIKLQDAAMVMLGVFIDPAVVKPVPNWTLFSTSAERGIHLSN